MIPLINGFKKELPGRLVFPTDTFTCSGYTEMLMVLQERLNQLPRYTALFCMEDREDPFVEINVRPGMPAGAYLLNIYTNGVQVNVSYEEGIANALTTLYWLIRKNDGNVPCCELSDSPQKPYRGILLDCSRHFFDVATVKSMIEQCALRKLNRVHWHLSDDQGYRIESKRFPELNMISSWRIEMDGIRYGGYYSMQEIRNIVHYAAVRGIEIVPEVGIPGHVTALIAAHPEHSCSGEPADVVSSVGIHNRILCAGKDEAVVFIKELYDEICPLFPYEYFHIGGDEAPKAEWEKCPHCRSRIKKEGLSGTEELQAWFMQQVQKHLESHGKKVICWNESLKSGKLNEDAVVQYWYEETGTYAEGAFNPGRKYIYSESKELYFDYSPAMTPLRTVLKSIPHFADGTPMQEDDILGYEACLWAEQIYDRTRLEQMAFPRIFGLAQRGWCADVDYTAFNESCIKETAYLLEDGIAHHGVKESDLSGQAQLEAIVADWKPKVQLVRMVGQEMYIPMVCNAVKHRLIGIFTSEEIDWVLHEIVS